MPQTLIRALNPVTDRSAVAAVLAEARDYYQLWLGRDPGPAEVEQVFTAGPPGCDPAKSHRLGLYLEGRLAGVAEVSYGFPLPDDAYLGLMVLSPKARNQGHGAAFYTHVEGLARPSPHLYLAVLQANPKGRAFWHRMGFAATGISRHDPETGHTIHRLVKDL